MNCRIRCHIKLSHYNEKLSRYNEKLSRYNEKLSRYNEIKNDLASVVFERLARVQLIEKQCVVLITMCFSSRKAEFLGGVTLFLEFYPQKVRA